MPRLLCAAGRPPSPSEITASTPTAYARVASLGMSESGCPPPTAITYRTGRLASGAGHAAEWRPDGRRAYASVSRCPSMLTAMENLRRLEGSGSSATTASTRPRTSRRIARRRQPLRSSCRMAHHQGMSWRARQCTCDDIAGAPKPTDACVRCRSCTSGATDVHRKTGTTRSSHDARPPARARAVDAVSGAFPEIMCSERTAGDLDQRLGIGDLRWQDWNLTRWGPTRRDDTGLWMSW
jgi:hypothetical protein